MHSLHCNVHLNSLRLDSVGIHVFIGRHFHNVLVLQPPEEITKERTIIKPLCNAQIRTFYRITGYTDPSLRRIVESRKRMSTSSGVI